MRTLHISVVNKIATYRHRDGDIVCGNSDYEILFTFDAEWDAYETKTARFIWGGQYFDVEFTGNTCTVPVIQNASTVSVGVYAGQLSTTTSATIGCKSSILCGSAKPNPGTGQNYTTEAQEAAEQAKDAAERAEESASSAVGSVHLASEEALRAQRFADDSRASATDAMQSADEAEDWAKRAENDAHTAGDAAFEATRVVETAKTELRGEFIEDFTILDKRVTNLEQGITPDPFVTDTTGIVPVNALPYAEVVKVGGMTYRDEATNTLKDAKPTSIESRGANLIPFPYADGSSKTINGVTFTVQDDGSVYAKGETADTSASFYLCRGIVFADQSVWAVGAKTPYGGKTFQDVNYYKSSTSDTVYIEIKTNRAVDRVYYPMIHEGETALPYKPYRGAIDTLAIPEAVQGLDGYGLGINADCYNHVDWEKKQFVQNVGEYTFSGAEAIKIGSKQTVNGLNVFIMNQHSIPYSLEKNTPILAESYDYKGTVDATNRFYEKEYSNGSMYAYYSPNYGTMRLYFVSDIADVETFAQSITGMKMLYKLAEPIVTDISDLLPDDNFIEVEGGGTIVAVNVENLEAPTEITYMTKEV